MENAHRCHIRCTEMDWLETLSPQRVKTSERERERGWIWVVGFGYVLQTTASVTERQRRQVAASNLLVLLLDMEKWLALLGDYLGQLLRCRRTIIGLSCVCGPAAFWRGAVLPPWCWNRLLSHAVIQSLKMHGNRKKEQLHVSYLY